MDLTGLTEKKNQSGTFYYETAEGEITAKECKKCGEVKSLSSYHRFKKGLAGRRPDCIECRKIPSSKYYKENKPKFKEYYKKYYQDNLDVILVRNKDYYRINHENMKRQMRERYENNRDELLIQNREWRRRNPQYDIIKNNRRRARKESLPETLNEEQYEKIMNRFHFSCALSQEGVDLNIDHVVPIATGHGGTTYENLIPLRADLNMSKRDHNIFEWFTGNHERFGLSQQRFDELIEYLADINGLTPQEYEDFVYWCHDNPRTVDEIEADNEKYGYKKPSIEIWREQLTGDKRDLIEV